MFSIFKSNYRQFVVFDLYEIFDIFFFVGLYFPILYITIEVYFAHIS